MMNATEARENLQMMRRDGMSLKVEKKFLTLALSLGRLSKAAKAVYAERIKEL